MADTRLHIRTMNEACKAIISMGGQRKKKKKNSHNMIKVHAMGKEQAFTRRKTYSDTAGKRRPKFTL
jgi:hypothetical protein